jgi:hypothetical protein
VGAPRRPEETCLTPDVVRCVTCPRKSNQQPVCDACRTHTLEYLRSIPQLLDRLIVALAGPPVTGMHEYVSGGAFGSRLPVDEQALMLVTATPEAVRTAVTRPLPNQNRSIPLFVVEWASWWRHVQGHHHRPTAELRGGSAAQLHRRASSVSAILGLAPARALLPPNDPAVTSTVDDHGRRKANPAVAEHWRRLPTPDDPLEDRWTERFGTRRVARRVAADLAYLQTWVRELWNDEDMPQFVDGLRVVYNLARAVLGEQPAEQRLGRCPVPRWDRARNRQMVIEETDPVSGQMQEVPVYCGQMLVRVADVSRVVCSRCGSEWDDLSLWTLAARMRDVWGESAGRDAWG